MSLRAVKSQEFHKTASPSLNLTLTLNLSLPLSLALPLSLTLSLLALVVFELVQCQERPHFRTTLLQVDTATPSSATSVTTTVMRQNKGHINCCTSVMDLLLMPAGGGT